MRAVGRSGQLTPGSWSPRALSAVPLDLWTDAGPAQRKLWEGGEDQHHPPQEDESPWVWLRSSPQELRRHLPRVRGSGLPSILPDFCSWFPGHLHPALFKKRHPLEVPCVYTLIPIFMAQDPVLWEGKAMGPRHQGMTGWAAGRSPCPSLTQTGPRALGSRFCSRLMGGLGRLASWKEG